MAHKRVETINMPHSDHKQDVEDAKEELRKEGYDSFITERVGNAKVSDGWTVSTTDIYYDINIKTNSQLL